MGAGPWLTIILFLLWSNKKTQERLATVIYLRGLECQLNVAAMAQTIQRPLMDCRTILLWHELLLLNVMSAYCMFMLQRDVRSVATW